MFTNHNCSIDTNQADPEEDLTHFLTQMPCTSRPTFAEIKRRQELGRRHRVLPIATLNRPGDSIRIFRQQFAYLRPRRS